MELTNELLARLPRSLQIEIEENALRKDLTQSELGDQQARILAILREQTQQGRRTDLDGGTSAKVFAQVEARATDVVGRLFGESGRQVEKRLAVCAAAKAEPERFGKLVADMNRNGRVNGPYRRLCNTRQAEAIRASPPPLPDGQWHVGVCDCPWPSEPDDPEPSDRGYWPFPTMAIAAMCALAIGSRFHDNAILWFWVTNFHMRFAYEILDAWGFRDTPTILTWVKDQPGRGQRLRGQTEQCIMAVRGKPIVTLTNQTTVLFAPTPKPPAMKPPEFYDMVARLCPASAYLDVFSRYQHNNKWTCWGDQAPPAAMGDDREREVSTSSSAPESDDVG